MNKEYLALLRGINVGGNNIIKMADLKVSFEKMGFAKVKTYIQSGNVLFETECLEQELEAKIEKQLSKDFNYKSTVVIISANVFKDMVRQAPKTFGTQPEKYKYDYIFLKSPLTAKEALTHVSLRDGVDTAKAGSGVLYFSRLTSQLSKSHLSKIIKSPIYSRITIRNWNTTTKLCTLLESRQDD